MSTLRMDDKGEEVKELQQILHAQGFLKGEIDDKFLKRVRNAVIYFQETHVGPDGEFLEPDGIVGSGTWWALRNPSGDAQKSYLPALIPQRLTPLRRNQLEIAVYEHQQVVQEDPDGSNWGDGVIKYGGNKNPWCCYFWSWCNKECLGAYSLGARYGSCASAWDKANELGMARLKEKYIPIPGDAFVMLERDKDGKFTGSGHIGLVMRVDVQDGKAIAINTVEGNASNRVKIGKRMLSSASMIGFINNFPANEQPTNWETGLVRSTSVENVSTRGLSPQIPKNVVDFQTDYKVVDQQNVALNIGIGDAQIGVSVVFLDDTEIGRGDIANLSIGSGEKIRGKKLKIKSIVTDVNDLSNYTSIAYSLSGGVTNQTFPSKTSVAVNGGSIVYRATFTLA